MYIRPTLVVFGLHGQSIGQISTPAVFTSPIRPDIVHMVHLNHSKNRRQPYAVSCRAGHKTAAESWGTGRALARIPRVPGGGTHRSGSGAFGNMCRGGHMYAPTKIWRRWHRKMNTNVKRFAMVSALAASALAPLVMARGHRIESVPEIPLIMDDAIQSVWATKKALTIIDAVGARTEIERCSASRHIRAGRGKMRNRRYITCKGPIIVHANDYGISRGFRNIPGVKIVNVELLNILELAPGGHMGRFIVWTKSAIASLNQLFGSFEIPSEVKKGYVLPRACMTNPNLSHLINSDEVQSLVTVPQISQKKRPTLKKNPSRNKTAIIKLNPYFIYQKKNKKTSHGKITRRNKTTDAIYMQLSDDCDR